MLLDRSPRPTFVAPQVICWAANLQPQNKSTFTIDSLIGRGSGESFQPGFVMVQPNEGRPVVASPWLGSRHRSRALDRQYGAISRRRRRTVRG
ncbi:hypothetical protein [Actinomyces viscosus]|uniref:hypothetical protein n=1 Tax=Actinomyces viscosus TaxID=1656 RepID=UPI0028F137A8|nr:hypothetical protein [Actinomyces viscosus]